MPRYNPIKLRDLFRKVTQEIVPPVGGYVRALQKLGVDPEHLKECEIQEIPTEKIYKTTFKFAVTISSVGEALGIDNTMITSAIIQYLSKNPKTRDVAVAASQSLPRIKPAPHGKHVPKYGKDVVEKFDFQYMIARYIGEVFDDEPIFSIWDRTTHKRISRKTILVKMVIDKIAKMYRWKSGDTRYLCVCFKNEKYLDANEIQRLVMNTNDPFIIGVSLDAPDDNFCKKCARDKAIDRYFKNEKRDTNDAKS